MLLFRLSGSVEGICTEVVEEMFELDAVLDVVSVEEIVCPADE